MKRQIIGSGFTLIELIVSMSIFSIMMVSVISVFLFSSQMSTQVELNRVMQENMKNVLENIAEGVRKEGILGVRKFNETCTVFQKSGIVVSTGTSLCLPSGEYTIGKKDTTGTFLPLDATSSYCKDIENTCYILKKENGAPVFYPLTNSFISFEKIEFLLTNDTLPKLTILFQSRPAVRKGLSAELIEKSRLHIQTTLSTRLIETK